jgi:hypothetical protein
LPLTLADQAARTFKMSKQEGTLFAMVLSYGLVVLPLVDKNIRWIRSAHLGEVFPRTALAVGAAISSLHDAAFPGVQRVRLSCAIDLMHGKWPRPH